MIHVCSSLCCSLYLLKIVLAESNANAHHSAQHVRPAKPAMKRGSSTPPLRAEITGSACNCQELFTVFDKLQPEPEHISIISWLERIAHLRKTGDSGSIHVLSWSRAQESCDLVQHRNSVLWPERDYLNVWKNQQCCTCSAIQTLISKIAPAIWGICKMNSNLLRTLPEMCFRLSLPSTRIKSVWLQHEISPSCG